MCLKISAVISSLIILAAAGCGKDNPLSPTENNTPRPVLADYLPLQGTSQDYSFSLSQVDQRELEHYISHKVKGICHLNFEPTADGNSFTRLIATASFEIQYDSLINWCYAPAYSYLPADPVVTARNGYTEKASFELFFNTDTLWYRAVGKSDSGMQSPSVMMDYSFVRGGSLFDLAPFLLPGWEVKPGITWDNKAEIVGDTLIYHIGQQGVFKFLKGLGLVYISFYYHQDSQRITGDPLANIFWVKYSKL